jgi:plastocyanin
MVAGALSMFLFSLGTVPLLFIFGALGSLLSSKFTKNMIKVSAMLVIVLGLVMANRGLAFTGFTFDAFAASNNYNSGNTLSSNNSSSSGNSESADSNTAVVNGDVQEITTKLESGRYTPITVQAGIPVKWTIKAENGSLNGCNNQIIIPQYNIQQDLKEGDNVITFTPDKTGKFGYSCWMGMIRSNITVTSGNGTANDNSINSSDDTGNESDSGVDNSGLPSGCCGN